ncbi:hypothetical protein CERZMDRAFT_100872 [Cercospora zeae-maydis SCOH1-5]|uniref:Phospholipase D-like domain-containing protein n=1 Tax=Cercospora zeae-maydis SCOH1-5 TaxID=717836 RepID=A0A6A6F6S4_9PEZI|nr:hypothetical protein CERZMDRAFT_100872 [Cercospora zeae-maydis SCOH1-5]
MTAWSKYGPYFGSSVSEEPKIQIATTFQRGITQIEAIEWLARLPNTEVYIFWNSHINFHAKYSLFLYREHSFDTAILGSSNLTITGVGIGVEVNVPFKICQGERTHL